MRKTLTAGLVAGVVAAVGLAVPATAIGPDSANLYVLHAIPGPTVDVYVNGALTLDDFTPGTLTDAIDLPAGDYVVAITEADAPDDSAPIIGPATVPLAAGKSYTAVAHLTAAGENTLTAFENNIAATAAGQGRLTVRHTAAAPAVDVLANGAVAVPALTNPNEATLDLPVGTISAAVAAAGTTEPVIGPADVAIQDGVLTIAYAWGSLEADNLQLAVQTINVGHSNPGGVPSGTAGYAAERDAMVQAGWTVGAAAIFAIGAVTFLMIRRARVES